MWVGVHVQVVCNLVTKAVAKGDHQREGRSMFDTFHIFSYLFISFHVQLNYAMATGAMVQTFENDIPIYHDIPICSLMLRDPIKAFCAAAFAQVYRRSFSRIAVLTQQWKVRQLVFVSKKSRSMAKLCHSVSICNGSNWTVLLSFVHPYPKGPHCLRTAWEPLLYMYIYIYIDVFTCFYYLNSQACACMRTVDTYPSYAISSHPIPSHHTHPIPMLLQAETVHGSSESSIQQEVPTALAAKTLGIASLVSFHVLPQLRFCG